MADTPITVTLSREEAKATIEGLKHADASPLPLRDSRHGAIGKIQTAIAEADAPPPEGGATGATGEARGARGHDTRAPFAKGKSHG
jgi:hypothetical protein